MKWRRRGILALAAFITVLMVLPLVGRPRTSTRANVAIYYSNRLLEACVVYRDNGANPERGKYPSAIAVLADPQFTEGKGFFTGGEVRLIDPWGNPYRYSVQKTATGEEEVYIWAEWVSDGKLKLAGVKRRADGQTHTFKSEK